MHITRLFSFIFLAFLSFSCSTQKTTTATAETEPKEALKYLSSLSEYVIPKLGRTEFSGEIDTKITVHFKDGSTKSFSNLSLDAATSQKVFNRTNEVTQINVHVTKKHLK